MIRRLAICFLIILFSLQAKAIDAVIAHTLFYAADPATGKMMPELETYWQVNQRSVHYKTNAEKMIVARILTNITFSNDKGIIKEDEFIVQTVPRANADELVRNNIIDLRRYNLSAGMIHMKFVMKDLADSTNKFAYTDSFIVVPYKEDAFYSEVEFLDTTIESDAPTAFKKNGHQQIPICSDFIDQNKKNLHYYAELYGADKIPTTDYPLIQKIFIAHKEDESSYDNVIKTDTIVSKSTTLVSGSFPIASQASGNYYLVMTLENKYHQPVATRAAFFQRLNPHPEVKPEVAAKKAAAMSDTSAEKINLLNLSKTFVGKYDLAQVKSILKMLLPFSDFNATRTIEGFLKKPDDMYMRYYIYNYFTAINKDDPGRAWKEFSEKIVEVNKLYSVHGTPGYATDRGFTYLRYGPPTDVITVESEQGAYPYEIWQYNMLVQINKRSMANAVFLFYKPNEIGNDFRLLHSTVTGEIQNGAWQSYLYKNGTAGSNSRAMQYLQN